MATRHVSDRDMRRMARGQEPGELDGPESVALAVLLLIAMLAAFSIAGSMDLEAAKAGEAARQESQAQAAEWRAECAAMEAMS